MAAALPHYYSLPPRRHSNTDLVSAATSSSEEQDVTSVNCEDSTICAGNANSRIPAKAVNLSARASSMKVPAERGKFGLGHLDDLPCTEKTVRITDRFHHSWQAGMSHHEMEAWLVDKSSQNQVSNIRQQDAVRPTKRADPGEDPLPYSVRSNDAVAEQSGLQRKKSRHHKKHSRKGGHRRHKHGDHTEKVRKHPSVGVARVIERDETDCSKDEMVSSSVKNNSSIVSLDDFLAEASVDKLKTIIESRKLQKAKKERRRAKKVRSSCKEEMLDAIIVGCQRPEPEEQADCQEIGQDLVESDKGELREEGSDDNLDRQLSQYLESCTDKPQKTHGIDHTELQEALSRISAIAVASSSFADTSKSKRADESPKITEDQLTIADSIATSKATDACVILPLEPELTTEASDSIFRGSTTERHLLETPSTSDDSSFDTLEEAYLPKSAILESAKSVAESTATSTANETSGIFQFEPEQNGALNYLRPDRSKGSWVTIDDSDGAKTRGHITSMPMPPPLSSPPQKIHSIALETFSTTATLGSSTRSINVDSRPSRKRDTHRRLSRATSVQNLFKGVFRRKKPESSDMASKVKRELPRIAQSTRWSRKLTTDNSDRTLLLQAEQNPRCVGSRRNLFQHDDLSFTNGKERRAPKSRSLRRMSV